MRSHIEQLLVEYRTKGVLVDTNLLLLYVVGVYDPSRIERWNRTRAFPEDDFELLVVRQLRSDGSNLRSQNSQGKSLRAASRSLPEGGGPGQGDLLRQSLRSSLDCALSGSEEVLSECARNRVLDSYRDDVPDFGNFEIDGATRQIVVDAPLDNVLTQGRKCKFN